MTNCRSLNGKICIQINHPALLRVRLFVIDITTNGWINV